MSVPVSAETLFSIGSLPVTNSLLTGWIVVAIFLGVAFALRGRAAMTPTGLQNAAEAVIEAILDFMDQVTHDRARSKRFLPLVGTLFLFILVANWMGLIPGFGTIGIWKSGELVPIFRTATGDLNMTLAMSVTAVVLSHVFGIITIGFFRYANKFIQLGGIWKAVAKFGHASFGDWAIGMFTAIVEFGVGIIELLSEVAKLISLSLRLFGNVFAGEVLLTVLSSLVAYIVPMPFMFLEIIVGIVQAMVFSTLTLVYLTIATEQPHGEEAAAH